MSRESESRVRIGRTGSSASVMSGARSRSLLVVSCVVFLSGVLASCAGSVGQDPESGSEVTTSPVPSMNAEPTTTTLATPSTIEQPFPEPSTTAAVMVLDPYVGARPAEVTEGEVSDQWIDTPDGRRRHFRLYVPSSLPVGEPVPLLIALHGGLGTSEQFAANSGFDELAEANGFVVLYPDGIRGIPDRPGFQTWNGGYCCGPAANKNVDDVGYVDFLIDVMEERFEVDEGRIYAVGHSNGGIMAYRLACELSDRIVAIGVQAGSLGIDDCVPGRRVAVLHIHGLADTNHPIDGGAGTGVAGVEFRSAREAVRILADLNECDDDPIVESVPTMSDLEVSTWSNCEAEADVRLVTVDGASHAWMGHAAASDAAAALVGEPYADLDASLAMWSFLVGHARR